MTNETMNNATINNAEELNNETATAEKEETMNENTMDATENMNNEAQENMEQKMAEAQAALLEMAFPEIGTTTVSFTAKGIDQAFKSGKMTSDNAIQRSDVWKPEQRDLLVHSIITGFPIPQFISIRSETTNEKGKPVLYDDLLDGKQRTTTIRMFRRDEHRLGNLRPVVVDGNAYDISGKVYSELPEEVQDKFDSRTFSFIRIDGADDETEAEIFARMNNGSPMSAVEKCRCKAADLATIKELAHHELFESTLTANAFKRYQNEDIVVKAYMMLTTKKADICLDNKAVRPVMEALTFDEEDKSMLEEVFDYILEVYREMTGDGLKTPAGKAAKKMMVRTHLISTIPMVEAAITKEITVEDYAAWVQSFYGGKIDTRYTANASSGSNHHAQVEARWNILETSFNKYFKGYVPKKDEEAAEEPVNGETETAEEVGNGKVETAEETTEAPAEEAATETDEDKAIAEETADADEDEELTEAEIAEMVAAIAKEKVAH